MAISLKHNFQSAVADEGDTSLVRPSNWNAEHDLTLATSRLVGRTTAGTGSAEEISVGTGLNLSSGSLSVSSTTPQVNTINTFTVAQVIETTDNSNPALRITQLGTADALRVEDETSPDATPFVITAAGHAIAGYGSTLTIETVVPQFQSHTATLDEGGFGGVDWGNTATGQVNWFGKSRGGSYGTQAIVQNNDIIGDFRFYGSDGVNLIPAARIEVEVDGTPGVNDMPGRIGFFTTPDGATVPTEKMRIANDGTVTITGTGVINAASANDGLRITQTGSGNALVVEDSTNPDSTPFIVKADGKVGIGEDAPSFTLQVATPNASTQTQMGLTSTNYTSDFKAVYLQYSDASTTGTTYGITNAGLGSLLFQNTSNALIGTNGGTPLIFGTTSLERMRIDSAGNVGIGTTSPGAKLQVTAGRIFLDQDFQLTWQNAGTNRARIYGDSSNNFVVENGSGNTERFRIGPSGQIGIGGANYGTATQYMKSGGASAAPSWATISNTDISGLGTMSTQNDNSVSITGGSITGITDLAVADGGTGASDAAGARTNLGLGTIATQAANNVSITGGSISGITDLAVADGGTGVSSFTAYSVLLGGTTSAGALQNVSGLGTVGQVLASNGAGAAPTWQGALSKAANGYITLQSGIIIQWGEFTMNASTTTTHNFPIAFPTLCAGIGWGMSSTSTGQSNNSYVYPTSASQFRSVNGIGTAYQIRIIAVGY